MTSLPELLTAVKAAEKLGQAYQLMSKKQVKTLAKCCLELGDRFPLDHPDAMKILEHPRVSGWRKRDLLEEWLPRGRMRDKLLAPYHDNAQNDNFRPLA